MLAAVAHQCRALCLWPQRSSVGVALKRRDLFVLSDISLANLPPSQINALLNGPLIFQRYDLLPPPTLAKPGGLQMLIGRRGSYTSAHQDWFGMDAYLHLLQGEKVWWLAPPQSQAAFHELFKGGNVNVSSITKEMTSKLVAMGACAIIQKAGDVVFMPGGWVHCVKNLADTVAFGASYLRAWKLPYLVQYLIGTQQEGVVLAAEHLFDWPGAFDRAAEEPARYGISLDEAESNKRLHSDNKRRFHTLTSPSEAQLRRVNNLSVVYERSSKRRKIR